MTPQATRLIIHGRVQGVGYRAWLADRARREGHAGWVRNRREGTVEALIHATPESLAAFVEACRAGPPSARVTNIEVIGEPPTQGGIIAGDFAVLPTL
ncbi:acylphosphatase [Ancylobacter sp. MQZ15Z-1]|uniref:acylphosphatase n=1 Tax=Ancylobacter mangrovi TaxID=2972472 RepID=A0A9X2PG01_9HYPH|nr:acylphosphatase [Ancylobacter mangrovi]MCS0496684.1 acylphosphatase [Ancylobacter mangrovi]